MALLHSALKRFLHRRLSADDARRAIAYRFRQRERSFLALLRITVFGNPRSPYLPLFQHAGIAHADVAALVRLDGLEATLTRLYEAGIYLTPEEFKGRRPIQRPGLEIETAPQDFDNPLVASVCEAKTSGSRGEAVSVPIDLRLPEHEAAYVHQFLVGYGLMQRPMALWRGVPPVASGIRKLLYYSKLGIRTERWFAQNCLPQRSDMMPAIEFAREFIQTSRTLGWWMPEPEYVHQDEEVEIARWLAAQSAAGTPAHLDTNASSGVRVCLAALEHGLDISGTLFVLGGEPFTSSKDGVIRRVGCRGVCHYSSTETGHLGIACTAPAEIDEVHLLTDKVAVLQPDVSEAAGGRTRGPLVFTMLLPASSKIMINVESGDDGVLERRACGCPLDGVGFDLHLSQLRSHEKVTSEGLSYLRSDLVPLIEHILPAKFGGYGVDYQLVEVEQSGIPFVEILADPSIGPIDEPALLQVVYEWLRQKCGAGWLADFWVDARTVRVVRQRPYATASAKILPLYTLRAEKMPHSGERL